MVDDDFLYQNITPENHEKIGRLNSEEKKQLHKIVKSGAKIAYIHFKQIKGNDHIHTLTIEKNDSFPHDLSLPYLEELTVFDGSLNNSKFYFPELKKLLLFDMELTDLSFLCEHTKLERVDIKYCNLTVLPDFFNSLESLQVLSIIHNKLTSLEGFENLNKCINLSYIFLEENQISNLLEFKPLSSLPNLQYIDLSRNKIKNLNITHEVPKLKKLYFDNNDIQYITAIHNLPNLRILCLWGNNIRNLNFKALKNVPRLESILVQDNPIKLIRGLNNLPSTVQIEGVPDEYCKRSKSYFRSLGWEYVEKNPRFPKRLLKLHPDYIINEYLTLRMTIDKDIILYVKDDIFDHCAIVTINIPKDKLYSFENMSSIDEMIKEDDAVPDKLYNKIPLETQFWAHASNLQAWVENNYDTRLLHRNIAFPLLKKLTEAGDPVAKKVFKEEIAKRYASGHHNVVKFLRKEGYLDYFNEDELSTFTS